MMYMETTKIKPTKTISEIQSILASAGAEKIMIDYSDSEPITLVFSIKLGDNSIGYKLPCKTDSIFNYLQDKRSFPRDYVDKDHEQASRIAWRQILRWIQAQFALLDVGMVDIKEIFMPYCYDGKHTLYEIMEQSGFRELTYNNSQRGNTVNGRN